jgi:hypothetical protein
MFFSPKNRSSVRLSVLREATSKTRKAGERLVDVLLHHHHTFFLLPKKKESQGKAKKKRKKPKGRWRKKNKKTNEDVKRSTASSLRENFSFV